MPASLVDSVHKKTIDTAFRETVDKFPQNSFLVVPSSNGRGYYDNGFALSYIEALRKVDDLKTRFTDAGYSAGHRIAIALDNRPEHVLYKLALNSLGISCVPINPDYRASELSYILEHSEAVLIIYLRKQEETITHAQTLMNKHINTWCFDTAEEGLPLIRREKIIQPVNYETESSLLYTSAQRGFQKAAVYQINTN